MSLAQDCELSMWCKLTEALSRRAAVLRQLLQARAAVQLLDQAVRSERDAQRDVVS